MVLDNNGKDIDTGRFVDFYCFFSYFLGRFCDILLHLKEFDRFLVLFYLLNHQLLSMTKTPFMADGL